MTEDEKHRNQGEGNRDAAEQYNEATREFAKSGKVKEAAERATEDPQGSEQAEEAGKSRAKELDPDVHRNYDKPTRD